MGEKPSSSSASCATRSTPLHHESLLLCLVSYVYVYAYAVFSALSRRGRLILTQTAPV